ncbi:MAG: RNA pseudouridine synthase [Myxococcales bacterium]|nr:RNA pseudouridine synthase [Myxococcales bacterium]
MTERIFEGRGFFAVHKPPGVPVIPGRGEAGPESMRERIELELGRKVYVVHRLDRDTSGVLLFALTPECHRLLSMAFEEGRIVKRYLALVEGKVEAPLDLAWPLLPSRRGRMRVARGGEGGKVARTQVRPVEVFSEATLVEAMPLTGRTHQIRVHLTAAGHPLLFDHQYGRKQPLTAAALGGEGDEVVLSRTPLHAASLSVPAQEGIGPAEITAPLPGDMARALDLLRAS